jgi:hypothetical protein
VDEQSDYTDLSIFPVGKIGERLSADNESLPFIRAIFALPDVAVKPDRGD